MSSNNYLKKIAIVGASGNVGASTLKHLLQINHDISITIVSREDSTASFRDSSQITVKKGSYKDPAFLQAAFEGQDLAMFALSFMASNVQPVLIEAAAKAGVKWIVPNEYGGDGMDEEMFNAVPLVHNKVAARKQIDDLAKTHNGLKWIGVATNPWTEVSLNSGLFGPKVPSREITLWSGSGHFNSSSISQAGLGIAKLLSLPITSTTSPRASLEHYANNFVYISSFLITQQDLFDSVKRATSTTDSDWKITHSSIQERKRIAEEKFAQGDFMGGADLMYAYYMGEGMGGNFEAKAEEDRGVLGLQEESLDEVVKGALAAST